MVDLKLWKKWGFFDPKLGLIDPYLVLEETPKEFQAPPLSDLEWKTIATIFKKHPELVKIWAPNRDPEPERTPFTYSSLLKRIVLGEDVDRKYILFVQNKKLP
jgi:hypothetical protein